MRLLREVAPVPPDVTARALPNVSVPRDAVCEKRFVLDAVVAKKLVEVAFVIETIGNVLAWLVEVAVM